MSLNLKILFYPIINYFDKETCRDVRQVSLFMRNPYK